MRRLGPLIGSVVFFLLAPGAVAGVVPWLIAGWQMREPLPSWAVARVAGVALVVAGTAVLVHAFARFVREGVGTPSPTAPTERLVVGGLYRHVRNPMYVAVVVVILGQVLVLGHAAVLLYLVVVTAAFAAFVHWYEEPTLRRRYGESYEAYRRAVPAWWPRLRPWEAG